MIWLGNLLKPFLLPLLLLTSGFFAGGFAGHKYGEITTQNNCDKQKKAFEEYTSIQINALTEKLSKCVSINNTFEKIKGKNTLDIIQRLDNNASKNNNTLNTDTLGVIFWFTSLDYTDRHKLEKISKSKFQR